MFTGSIEIAVMMSSTLRTIPLPVLLGQRMVDPIQSLVETVGHTKNLFAGSDAGGECAVAMYSLIGSAQLNGIDPEALYEDSVAAHRRSSHIGSFARCH